LREKGRITMYNNRKNTGRYKPQRKEPEPFQPEFTWVDIVLVIGLVILTVLVAFVIAAPM
jgi:energy-coupling factor transporter transmembrane protein EcfT